MNATTAHRSSPLLALVAALALASVIGVQYLDFAAANAREGINWSRLLTYALYSIGVALLLSLALRVLLRRRPLWLVITALVPVAFAFFLYHEINTLLGLKSLDAAVTKVVAADAAMSAGEIAHLSRTILVRLAGWGSVLILVFLLGLRLLNANRAPFALLLIALLMGAPSAVTLAKSTAASGHHRPLTDVLFGGRSSSSPNIYWLVADGSPSHDTLLRDFQFENSAFESSLESLGFIVNRDTRANYPSTIYSVAASISSAYLLEETTPVEAVKDLASFREIVRGRNRTVASLREAGYRYIHFSNGYDFLTQCGGFEDICVQGTRSVNELDIALLGRTPLLDGFMLVSLRDKEALNSLAFGAFDEFAQALRRVRELAPPYFVYAHVIAPHPPMRFDPACGKRIVTPDLKEWKPENRAAFVDQIKCVNRQLEVVVSDILKQDRNAIIIIQSYHGSAFRGQFAPGADTDWDAAQTAERLGVLNAMKVPPACADSARQVKSLVNTFVVVLSCIHGTPPRLLPDRHFITPYDNSVHFGKVIEVR
mgnify:CR=1 FL=1